MRGYPHKLAAKGWPSWGQSIKPVSEGGGSRLTVSSGGSQERWIKAVDTNSSAKASDPEQLSPYVTI